MSDDAKVTLPNLEDAGLQTDVPLAAEPEGPTTVTKSPRWMVRFVGLSATTGGGPG